MQAFLDFTFRLFAILENALEVVFKVFDFAGGEAFVKKLVLLVRDPGDF